MPAPPLLELTTLQTVAPGNTVAPAVTGTQTVGSTLTTTDGTWTGASPTPAFTYQWQRGGVNIGSATASTYVLVDADDATNVRCVVTATNAGGVASANSNAVAITEPVATNSVAPVATGTATVAQTLSVTTGTWTHQGGTVATYAYQWKHADDSGFTVNVANATGTSTNSTYVIAAGESARYLRCDVTATNTGGTSSATSSNALGPVAALSSGVRVAGNVPVFIHLLELGG